MSIYSAMQSGVSGLFAQATKTSKIADNIANANTVGYKKVFADFVTNTSTAIPAPNSTYPAGVRAVTKQTVDSQGNFMSTNTATDMAIAGDGFFMVGKSVTDQQYDNFMLTRSGSFRPDENGFLQNTAGFYLHGYAFDSNGDLGNIDRNGTGDLTAINISDITMMGDATSYMKVSGNIPSQETGWDPLGVAPDSFFSSAEYFTPLGAKERVEFEWIPQADPNENIWTLRVSQDGTDFGTVDVEFSTDPADAGSPANWTNVTNLGVAPAGFSFDTVTGVATITVDNGSVPQNIEIELGAPGTFGGITQFYGDFTPQQIEKDGAAAGELNRVEISNEGIVFGVFDNGASRALYQIPIAQVTNPNGLMLSDGNTYRLTKEAGSFSLGEANSGATGAVQSGVLERSNVDIAEELTSLIETQRAYSSNAKIITTADEMLEETTRLKR